MGFDNLADIDDNISPYITSPDLKGKTDMSYFHYEGFVVVVNFSLFNLLLWNQCGSLGGPLSDLCPKKKCRPWQKNRKFK